MRRKALSIAVGMALVTGLLLVAGAAWAQAQKTPIEGQSYTCLRGEWERFWTTKDGVQHGRDRKVSCRHTGDLVGRAVLWDNVDVDHEAGLVSFHGYISFAGEVLSEPVIAVGRYTGGCERIEGVWICSEDHVWHLSDGGLLKISWPPHESGTSPSPYSGLLLDPPGRH